MKISAFHLMPHRELPPISRSATRPCGIGETLLVSGALR